MRLRVVLALVAAYGVALAAPPGAIGDDTPSEPAPAPAPAAPPPVAPAPAAPAPEADTEWLTTAPAAPPPAGGSGSVSPPAPAADASTAPLAAVPPPPDDFSFKAKNLEEQVNDLKEKIFRTKARLLLLQETIIGGDVTSGAKAVLVHRNEMGSSFVLENVAYALDGAPIYTKVDDSGELDSREEFEIFNGRIVPGNHQISVKLTFRGHGGPLFSYLDSYKFKVQSSYTFNAEAGKITQVKIVGYEKGGITTDLKDRPAVRYDVEVTRDQTRRPTSADASPPPPAP